MTPRVKQLIRDYLESVNLETVRKDLRMPLVKYCIHVLSELEKSDLLDKMRVIYPFIGTMKPIVINNDNK
jgi:hypothetical protein